MSVIAAMLVGPGEAKRYLRETLPAAAWWSDKLVILGDHVDDETREVITDALEYAECSIDFLEGADSSFLDDESEVRNRLLALVDQVAEPGDLVVIIDADEELDAGMISVRRILDQLHEDRRFGLWSVTFYHLWDAEGTAYRVDGSWRPGPSYRVYRHVPGARIMPRAVACGSLPGLGDAAEAASPLGMLHWGYAREKDRKAKHKRYMEIDGGRFHRKGHLESIITEPSLRPFPPR